MNVFSVKVLKCSLIKIFDPFRPSNSLRSQTFDLSNFDMNLTMMGLGPLQLVGSLWILSVYTSFRLMSMIANI